MSTVTKAANAHTIVATGWTTPENAYATTNDSTYATLATAKNATRSGDFGFPAFTTAEIPDHSTLTSVVFFTTYGLTAVVTGGEVAEQARRNSTGATLGSEIVRTLASMADANGTATGCTLTDLRTANELRVRARATRGNTNSASTAQIDRLYVTVTFTEDVSASAGALALTATLAETGRKATSASVGALGLSTGGAVVGLKAVSATAGAIALTSTLGLTGSAATGEPHSGTASMTLTAALGAAGTKAGSGTGVVALTATEGATGRKGASATGGIALTAAEGATGRKAGTATAALTLVTGGTSTGRKAVGGTASLTLVPGGNVVETKQTSGSAGALALTLVLGGIGINGEVPVVVPDTTPTGPVMRMRRQVIQRQPVLARGGSGHLALVARLGATGYPVHIDDDEVLIILEAA